MIKKLDVLTDEKKEINRASEEYEIQIKQDNKMLSLKTNELKDLEVSTNRMDVKLDSLLASLSEDYSMSYEKAKENYKLEIKELRISSQQGSTLHRER